MPSLRAKETLSALLGCTALCAGAPAAPSSDEKLPNILIIYIDDLGYGDLTRTGNPRVHTPHMDSIAQNGAVLREGYVSGAMCAPSRAGIMSGRYQTRNGFEFNYRDYEHDGNGLDKSLKIFPQFMKDLGYATGFVGKWHLGEASGFRPEQRGFDEVFRNELGDYVEARAQAKAANAPEPEDITLRSGKDAEKFIAKHQAGAWFLYFAPHAVHSPFPVLDRYRKRFDDLPEKQAAYYGMIECLDDAVGGILEKLRVLGLEERTLIFFASDNGAPRTREKIGSNAPFEGFKYQVAEGGVRSPIAVQWKGRVPAGQMLDGAAIQLDFLPTALASAGVKNVPKGLDGVNLLPWLEGNAPNPRHNSGALFWKIGPQFAVRQGKWKWEKPYVNAKARLLDLSPDSDLARDYSAQFPEKAAELDALWKQWDKGNEPARWLDTRSQPRSGIFYKPKATVSK